MDVNKMTAVEWLEEKRKWSVITNEDIEQAKEMEKEQMENNWKEGMKSDNGHFGTFEQYYTKTYNK